jgi:hypothetical protein
MYEMPKNYFLENLARVAKTWDDETLLNSMATAEGTADITAVLEAEFATRTS